MPHTAHASSAASSAASARPCSPVLLALVLLLLAGLVLPAGQAEAATFRCKYFTLNLPRNWSLINGPFKKGGGETAVLGRRDHKASVQLIYGTSVKENFRTIVDGYAKSLKAKATYTSASQAWFDTQRKGQTMRFHFCQDEAESLLAIFILNGKPEDMAFVHTGMQTKYKGLVPQPAQTGGKAKGKKK